MVFDVTKSRRELLKQAGMAGIALALPALADDDLIPGGAYEYMDAVHENGIPSTPMRIHSIDGDKIIAHFDDVPDKYVAEAISIMSKHPYSREDFRRWYPRRIR